MTVTRSMTGITTIAGRDGERQQDEVVQRAADIGDAVAQEQAAGRQHLPDIADAFARAEHRADLRREQARHLFEGLAEPQSLFKVRCQEMEADP